ncbi:MAG TPA: hypothetical protein VFG20_01325, partial [Planctomycetaceae bacterium]|nr:hypothetical protein [Planctomycetaceae bacterium]
DGHTAEVLGNLEGAPKFTIDSVKIDGNQCTLVLAVSDSKIDYQGTLSDGLVRGTMQADGNGGVAPAMLRPTKETKYDPQGWDPAPVTPGADFLVKAYSEKEQPAAVISAATELRGNPLSLEAFNGVFSRLSAFPTADDQSLKTIAKLFLDAAQPWGPRLADQVRATVILNTAASRKYPRIAQQWLKESKEKLSPAAYETYKDAIVGAQEQVAIDIALIDIKAEDAEVAKAAYEGLEGRLSTQRYNPELLDALAIYANAHEMPDKAIEYWADIVSLPLLEGMWIRMQQGKPPGDGSPRERLLKVWEAKNGNVEGFDKFLEETYNRRMSELGDEVRKTGPAKSETDNARTILVELFTGSTCPPCIAGDVALDLVTDDYSSSKVIALRYHQHIPGPDPLANQDTEDRFGYYEGTGTPLMVVDGGGVPAPGVGGMLQHVGQSYTALRKGVDSRFEAKSDVKINVTATLENGEVVVNADAVGWPEDKAKRLRLRVALVENAVPYLAANGIRVHEHLVRTMIGGAKGTAVKSGKLAIDTKVSLGDLKQTLTEYLTQFEKNRGTEFPIKPLALENLSVVAWVQNDENREVLQSVIIPVTGSAPAAASAQ